MANIKINDELDVRDVEGETICITPITAIIGDVIETHYGKFRITGQKNMAGREAFDHIVGDEDYSAIHAVLKGE